MEPQVPDDRLPGVSPPLGSDQGAGPPSRSEEDLFDAALKAATPRAFVTRTLLVVNAAAFIAMIASGVPIMEPSIQNLIDWGANFGPETMAGEWWRLLTSTFLHIGVLHLAFNMWVLRDIGLLVERLVGNAGFLILYIVSGLLASTISLAWSPMSVSAGASGAIFGLLGALVGVLLQAPGEIPRKRLSELRRSCLFFLGFNIIYGALNSSVDMAAHLGGLGTGLLCGLILSHPAMLKETGRRNSRNAMVAGLGLITLVGLCLLLPRSYGHAQKELDHFAEVESSCIDALEAAAESMESGEISEAGFAAILDRNVLSPWRDTLNRLVDFREVPASMEDEFRDVRKYMALRERAWTQLSRSIHEQDPSLFRDFLAKQEEIDRILQERNVVGNE